MKRTAKIRLLPDADQAIFLRAIVPDGSPIEPTDSLGVDLSIANNATDSDGNQHSGATDEKVRRTHNLQRHRPQRKHTGGEEKDSSDERQGGSLPASRSHHVISKQIVETAKRTGRAIGLEDLTDIRKRVTARGGDARNRLGSWGFAPLGAFIGYKA